MAINYIITGGSVGSKVTKVAEKVATDTAEDLRQVAGDFEGVIPDLVWLRDPPRPPRPPTPVITIQPPTRSPSPTPSLEITFEPLERRMRKAKGVTLYAHELHMKYFCIRLQIIWLKTQGGKPGTGMLNTDVYLCGSTHTSGCVVDGLGAMVAAH